MTPCRFTVCIYPIPPWNKRKMKTILWKAQNRNKSSENDFSRQAAFELWDSLPRHFVSLVFWNSQSKFFSVWEMELWRERESESNGAQRHGIRLWSLVLAVCSFFPLTFFSFLTPSTVTFSLDPAITADIAAQAPTTLLFLNKLYLILFNFLLYKLIFCTIYILLLIIKLLISCYYHIKMKPFFMLSININLTAFVITLKLKLQICRKLINLIENKL